MKEIKICSCCNIEKPLHEFHKTKYTKDGRVSQCKLCRKNICADFYKKNKIIISKKRTKKYYENHNENLKKDRIRISLEKEKRNNRSKEYYEKNKDKVREYQKEHYKKNKENYIIKSKKWQTDNRERRNKTVNYRNKQRKKEDILFKLTSKIRTDIYVSLKRKKRSKKIEDIVGLPLEEYKKYIESMFEEWMSWENWGKNTWHIDHKIPLCSAKNEEEILRLWHYTNLRPISAKENLRKGGKFYE